MDDADSHPVSAQTMASRGVVRGILMLLGAEFSFALATVFVKLITSSSKVPAIELSLFRFAAGFLLVAVYVAATGKTLVPANKKFVVLRSLFNTFAVIFFFMGIQFSTVTKVNILNMTYPLFVFMLAPIINREKTTPAYFLYLLLAMAGVYFVVVPDASGLFGSGINPGDMLGLASGIVAGFAITTLREARKYDESYIILFYLMAFGTVVNLAFAAPFFVVPRGTVLAYCIAATALSVLGQLFITAGYRYINAADGALVSTSRILFAILMGAIILSEAVTVRIISGGVMILVSLVSVGGVAGMARRAIFPIDQKFAAETQSTRI
ncbi:MAG TPA: DMT family transporter, partial [Spirochaetota bacterium]|nr:DMT family transporter [Spirochaetota bacterium]